MTQTQQYKMYTLSMKCSILSLLPLASATPRTQTSQSCVWEFSPTCFGTDLQQGVKNGWDVVWLLAVMPIRTDPTFYTDANPDSDPGPDPTLELVQVYMYTLELQQDFFRVSKGNICNQQRIEPL